MPIYKPCKSIAGLHAAHISVPFIPDKSISIITYHLFNSFFVKVYSGVLIICSSFTSYQGDKFLFIGFFEYMNILCRHITLGQQVNLFTCGINSHICNNDCMARKTGPYYYIAGLYIPKITYWF